ncbi:protein of unknown function [Burkholderia multivorans]
MPATEIFMISIKSMGYMEMRSSYSNLEWKACRHFTSNLVQRRYNQG